MKKKGVTAARVMVGLMYTIFGLNGFLNFIPVPPAPEAGMAYLMALGATGYFFPVLKATEVLAGVLLLANRHVGLGLILLAPITVQIFLYHAFLDPSGMPVPVILTALMIYLGFFGYREKFKKVLEK